MVQKIWNSKNKIRKKSMWNVVQFGICKFMDLSFDGATPSSPIFHLAEQINLLERSVKKLSREDKFLKAVRSSSRLILVIPRSEQIHCL